jgi:hypothetical protein
MGGLMILAPTLEKIKKNGKESFFNSFPSKNGIWDFKDQASIFQSFKNKEWVIVFFSVSLYPQQLVMITPNKDPCNNFTTIFHYTLR